MASICDPVARHQESGREASTRRFRECAFRCLAERTHATGGVAWASAPAWSETMRVVCHDLTPYVLFLSGLCAAELADLGCWQQELCRATLTAEGVHWQPCNEKAFDVKG